MLRLCSLVVSQRWEGRGDMSSPSFVTQHASVESGTSMIHGNLRKNNNHENKASTSYILLNSSVPVLAPNPNILHMWFHESLRSLWVFICFVFGLPLDRPVRPSWRLQEKGFLRQPEDFPASFLRVHKSVCQQKLMV